MTEAYDQREEELGGEMMRALERFMLLQIIDERWREHLHDMDYLREGIHLRGFAQIDPLVAYKNEGFEMFTELMNNVWEEFARYIFHVEVAVEEEEQQQRGPDWGLGGSSTSSTGRRRTTTPAAPPPTSRAPSRPPHSRPAERSRPASRRRPSTRPTRSPRRRRRSRPAVSRSTRRSAATTRVGAAPARNSRSAMAADATALRGQLKLLADYL